MAYIAAQLPRLTRRDYSRFKDKALVHGEAWTSLRLLHPSALLQRLLLSVLELNACCDFTRTPESFQSEIIFDFLGLMYWTEQGATSMQSFSLLTKIGRGRGVIFIEEEWAILLCALATAASSKVSGANSRWLCCLQSVSIKISSCLGEATHVIEVWGGGFSYLLSSNSSTRASLRMNPFNSVTIEAFTNFENPLPPDRGNSDAPMPKSQRKEVSKRHGREKRLASLNRQGLVWKVDELEIVFDAHFVFAFQFVFWCLWIQEDREIASTRFRPS